MWKNHIRRKALFQAEYFYMSSIMSRGVFEWKKKVFLRVFWRLIVLDWRMPIADIMCQCSAYLNHWEQDGTLNWIKTNTDEILMLVTVKQMRPGFRPRFSVQTRIIFGVFLVLVCWQPSNIFTKLQHFDFVGGRMMHDEAVDWFPSVFSVVFTVHQP